MFDDDDRTRDWAGGGGWQDNDPPPPSDPPKPPPPPPPAPKPKRIMPAYRPQVKRGLVAGRFLPLHLGHEHLIEVAMRSSEKLDIVVFAKDGDAVPGATRVRWLQHAYPWASVHETVATNDFAASIQKATGRRDYDVFYGGEIPAGIAAAKAIGATFLPVDPERLAFPVSGTQIRDDVMKHFGEISAAARPWFVRRVAVIGPESTGKTELCKRLAQIYGARFVPEPARALAAARGGDIDAEALDLWVRTQLASEEAVARRSSRVLFADTHARTALFWSRRLGFDGVSNEMAKHAFVPYDLVLLCNDEVPFVGRPERDDPSARRELFNELAISTQKDRRAVIGGTSWENRILEARKAVDQLLVGKELLSKRGQSFVETHLAG